MKVLSIDLDYFMAPTIELYQGLEQENGRGHSFDQNPVVRWSNVFEHTEFKESHFYIDQGNLLYCYHTFLKALKNNPKVVFGYEHDSILFQLEDEKDIDLINIDHHDDVMHGNYTFQGEEGLEREYYNLCNYNHVNEGNWIAWLHHKEKLNSAVWICNKQSGNLDRNYFNEKLLGDKYQTHLRTEYEIEDYNFDHVYVCLSPQYTPPNHWHYFTMFMMAYEETTGNDIELISNRKYYYERIFDQTTQKIINPEQEFNS